jgi:Rps23 Pro-64 3,4-dihydroxylase Tpa1-like proline 4-hydroxylase
MEFVNSKVFENLEYDNYPFPHSIIDNFLKDEILEELLTNVNNLKDEDADSKYIFKKDLNQYSKYCFSKHNCDFINKLFIELNSDEFISHIEKLTGIKKLIRNDITLLGAGINRIKNGGYLKCHTDFNSYYKDNIKLDRRINLIIYLNPNWKNEYNGDLKLFDIKKKTYTKTISPIMNRCVIFNTSNKSVHGHPVPLNVPDNISRQSISVYYYTENENGELDFEGDYEHDTIWHEYASLSSISLNKKIAILLTGEATLSPFLNNPKNQSEEILKSYNYFFSKNKYKTICDIFIATDELNIDKTVGYFGEDKLKNIYLSKTKKYYKSITEPVEELSYFIKNIHNLKKSSNLSIQIRDAKKNFYMYNAYNLLKNFKNPNEYDYIMVVDINVKLLCSLDRLVNEFEKDDKIMLLGSWTVAAVGKPEIMDKYLTLLNKNDQKNESDFVFNLNIISYDDYCKLKTINSQEFVLFNTLFNYCKNKMLTIDDAIKYYSICYL